MADQNSKSSLMDGFLHAAEVVEELIKARRSVRKYKSDPLPEAWIEAMLRCAVQAPSPSNSQPVRFVRIASQALKSELQQALVDGYDHFLAQHRQSDSPARMKNWINAYRRYSDFLFQAPVLLAVGTSTTTIGFGKRLAAAGLIEKDPRPETDLDISVGLALKGLLLKAQALGVASCILTAPLVFIGHVDRLLGLEDFKAKCFVTLGFAAESPGPTKRMALDEIYTVL